MATADKLTYLNATKLLLRDAIRRAGHCLPDAATFRSYPYAMLPDEASLNLDFVRGEYVAHSWRDGTVSRAGLSNIMTTTRASGGGYFDHLGVYQWAADNVPRIDHDPATVSTSSSSVTLAAGTVTLAVTVTYPVGAYVRATHDGSNWMAGRVTASTGSSVTIWADRVVGSGTYASWTLIQVRGLLVEESRTNLLTYSSDFANAAWTKSNASVVANTATAPDGTLTADKLVENTSGIAHALFSGIGVVTGTYTFSVYLKAAERTKATISLGSGTDRANIDLVAGTIQMVGTAGVSATIQPLPDGWFRASLTRMFANPFNTFGLMGLLNNADAYAYVGDGTSGVYIWGAQLEAGAFPTSYIPTTDAQVTRAADQCTITSLADWLGTENTIIIEHNAPSGRVLLSSGATVLATSQGPGKLAIACTATETRICQAGGSVTTSGPLTFDTSLRLLASATEYANAHVSVVQSIPRALSNTELQRITA